MTIRLNRQTQALAAAILGAILGLAMVAAHPPATAVFSVMGTWYAGHEVVLALAVSVALLAVLSRDLRRTALHLPLCGLLGLSCARLTIALVG